MESEMMKLPSLPYSLAYGQRVRGLMMLWDVFFFINFVLECWLSWRDDIVISVILILLHYSLKFDVYNTD